MRHVSEKESAGSQFLVSESASTPTGGCISLDSTAREQLQEKFPELLEDAQFQQKSMERLAGADTFGALVLQIDGDETRQAPAELFASLLRHSEHVCREKGGWSGLMHNCQAALVLPGVDEGDCIEIAKTLQAAFFGDTGKTATAGAAAYPTDPFAPSDILENARKALVHAEFFGPGSRVCFDSVSLNISGDQYYQKGDTAGAIREFKLALKLDPENVNVHNSLGVCYGRNGELEKALLSFKTASRLDPKELLPIYNAGYICMLRKDYQAARQYFQEAEKISPEVFALAYQTGRALMELQDPRAARKPLETAVRLHPRSNPAYRLLGDCYHQLDRLNDAAAAYKNALKLHPEDAAAMSNLGFIYELLEQNADIALMFCRQSSKMEPENALFRHRLARIYYNRNQMENALAEFEKAHELGWDCSDYIKRIRGSKKAAK
ncbi:MAG TPA: tetratricopeptide repeat protein [Desulfosalsimonadaceae bacterium]|nr:tetratricopeptide repeat protein [Desulfosalsimonadaceae bacterium]